MPSNRFLVENYHHQQQQKQQQLEHTNPPHIHPRKNNQKKGRKNEKKNHSFIHSFIHHHTVSIIVNNKQSNGSYSTHPSS